MERDRGFRCRAEVTLADGGRLSLGEGDFTLTGNGFSDGAGLSTLPVGCAVCRSVTISLLNDREQYAGIDFFGAELRLWLTFEVAKGSVETVSLGTFTVTEPERYGETVLVTAVDGMWRADVGYKAKIPFPAAISQIFRDVCAVSGLECETADFEGADFVVDAAPEGDYTCREMLGFAAMAAGGNAVIDRAGRCRIRRYDTEGGAHRIPSCASLRADTDDVVITGVSAGEESYGEAGYVVKLDNPLFAGREAEAAALVGARLTGMRVRRFECELPAYPLCEFMDKIEVTDRRGRAFRTFVTDVSFTFSGKTRLSCSVESAVRHGSTYALPGAEAVAEARRLVSAERTAREAAITKQEGQIAAKVSMTDFDKLGQRVSSAESTITQQADEIAAKVSKSVGTSSSAFGWSLTSSGWRLYSNAKIVLYASHSGLSIEGTITAKAGYIGGTSGWVIKSGAIYSGTSSMTSETKGAYIGIDGIRVYSSGSKYVNIRDGVLSCVGLDAQGYIIGGSWELGKHTTILNDLGLCITSQSRIYESGQYKAWILLVDSSGALVAAPAIYIPSTNKWKVQNALMKTIASPWGVQSGGGNVGSGGGPPIYPVALS